MYAQILTEKNGSEKILLKSALEIFSRVGRNQNLIFEFVPGSGVNLYMANDGPVWSEIPNLPSKKINRKVVMEDRRDPSLFRHSWIHSEKPKEDDPVAKFTPGKGVHYFRATRYQPENLALTSCALRILKRAEVTGTINIRSN